MEEKENYKDILRAHGLRITGCRLDVIAFFLKEKRTLLQSDLERQFEQYDRVTLYRTLNTFLDSGIVHKIPNASGVATYGLCHETCSPDHHDHNHIHFKCNQCGDVECITDRSVPMVEVPAGYKVEMVNLIVDGTCARCS